MTREEHLKYCRTCKLKSFDKYKGITCLLTNEIADFEFVCENFEQDHSPVTKPVNNTFAPNRNKSLLFILLVICIPVLALILVTYDYRPNEIHIEKNRIFDVFTKEDCIDFAYNLEAHTQTFDPVFLNRRVDLDHLEKLISIKASLSKPYRKELKKELNSKLLPGTELVNSLMQGGDYSFRKYYEKDSVPHLIFRLFSNQTIAYFDYELGIKKNEIVVLDAFNYIYGENWSDSYAEILKNNIDENLSKFELAIQQKEMSTMLYKLQRTRELINEEKFEDALKLYYSVPKKYRKGRVYDILEIEIISGIDMLEYSKKMDELIASSKDERFIASNEMLKNCSIGNIEGTKEAISTLNKHTGNDPILKCFIGLAYYSNHEYSKAIQSFTSFTEEYPNLIDGYWYLLSIRMEMNEIDEAMKVVYSIYDFFEISKEELTGYLSEYGALINSKEYLDFINEEDYND